MEDFMNSKQFLPEKKAEKLSRLRKLVRDQFDSQANFAMFIGAQESLVSRVLNGRRHLRTNEKMLWAQALKCEPREIFTDAKR